MTKQERAEEGGMIAGRVGLTARGVVYCALGVAAVQVAAGGRDQELDRGGALNALARQPLGPLLLWILAAGFAAYALWRFLEAALGDDEPGKRALHAARGVLYLAFTYSAVRLVLGRGDDGDDDDQAKTWSARAMEHGWGRWLVAAVGAACLAYGAYQLWRGLGRKFEEKLRTEKMHGWQRRWLPMLGMVGLTARGIVLGLIGAFFVRAALRFDPDEAVGVDGALHELARQDFGTLALGVVAFGLVAYGLYSFVEARFRDVIGS
jgi:hypothetical protein